MIQIPDISPFLKAGALGVMAFIVCVLVGVIVYLMKNQGVLGGQKIITREPTAGEKPPDYWEKIFAEIETDGNKALLQVLKEDHRAVMEMLGKLRAKIRDSDQAATARAVHEFRARYDQDMIVIAKMLRAIEAKFE